MPDRVFLFPSPSPDQKLLTVPDYQERGTLRTMAPYVPSKPDVVEGMLDLADLKPTDVLYDLGCGDGRIVFGAARRGVAQAIGVDIDPVFIAENRAEASKEGLLNASFLLGDIFAADIAAATVVTCYLLPKAMELLKPKFETSLKPGTRIISHAFRLDGWTPKQMAYPDNRLGTVYLWVV